MENNFKPKYSFPIISAIIGIVAIFVIVFVFAYEISPPILEPTPTVIKPTSSSSKDFQPEVIPPPTDIAEPTQTATSVPVNTPVPTQTLPVIPTLVSNRDLPDLIVSGLSDPVCAGEYKGTTIRFTIFVRNIGRAPTRDFGSFDVSVFFILGQHRYNLEEWDTVFNGLIGSSVTEVFNLHPDQDIKFTVVIDLKGNKEFGIEVIVNSGENPIREADLTNNTLMKYYSANCY